MFLYALKSNYKGNIYIYLLAILCYSAKITFYINFYVIFFYPKGSNVDFNIEDDLVVGTDGAGGGKIPGFLLFYCFLTLFIVGLLFLARWKLKNPPWLRQNKLSKPRYYYETVWAFKVLCWWRKTLSRTLTVPCQSG